MKTQSSNQYTSRRSGRRNASPQGRRATLTSIIAVLAFCLIAWGLERLSAANPGPSPVADAEAVALMRVELPDEQPSIMCDYEGFMLSFNPVQHVPNYVAWELTASEAKGENPRESKFAEDPNVYGSATPDDYRRSGYDRGHMAPAADMKWSRQAMADCHLLTNICPQSHDLNAGPWRVLEENCRQWAARDSAIIIVCGPVMSDQPAARIGRDVLVPQRFFKAIIAPWANPPRGIAFVMNNLEPNPGGVQPAAISIDQLEEITGYDFFAALPDDIEAYVESQCNYPEWQRRRH